MTTLEAAAEFGQLTLKQAKTILKEHDIEFKEAWDDIGDGVTDAYQLMQWIGY